MRWFARRKGRGIVETLNLYISRAQCQPCGQQCRRIPSSKTVLVLPEPKVSCAGTAEHAADEAEQLLRGECSEAPLRAVPALRWCFWAAVLVVEIERLKRAARKQTVLPSSLHEANRQPSHVISNFTGARVTQAYELQNASQASLKGLKGLGLGGVSLGGWLCLEDWFFSMGKGRLVSSAHEQGQGYALPPRIPLMNSPWTSEGLLTRQLINEHGQAYAIQAISEYRTHFVTPEDLQEIASAGLRKVRLPITWAAFADALGPLDQAVYASHNADLDIITVPDPFYKDNASLVTIPRKLLTDFLHEARAHGLSVILDVHAYPGGASHGTYNGVWPLKCAFWTEKSRIGSTSLTQIGLWIVDKLVHWIENMDLEAQGTIAGVTLMNEPGHMNRWKQFAPDQAILSWLGEASARFLSSRLPVGLKLYVSLVETAFQDFGGLAVPWYQQAFTLEERRTRVVADVHYYMAWNHGNCDGRSDGLGAYSCGADPATYAGVLNSCAAGFARSSYFRWASQGGLVSVSEFSVGTADAIDVACKEPTLLWTMLTEQLAAFRKYYFESVIWTWKMPYAPDFEPGWSLQWLLRQSQRPDRT
ncbi:exgA [Symbiodinium microadriaticum]|nr:exgA [Symbiodinium microadriaticum]